MQAPPMQVFTQVTVFTHRERVTVYLRLQVDLVMRTLMKGNYHRFDTLLPEVSSLIAPVDVVVCHLVTG